LVKTSRRYVQFLEDLKEGKDQPVYQPVYVFTGSDDFLKREALRRLCRLILSPEARTLNYQSFLGGDCEWSDVQAACSSSGLFSEKRVVALVGVELMGSADVSAFCDYARHPSEGTCLVAMTSSFSDESRRRGGVSLRRILAAAGEARGSYVFWKGDLNDCEAWVLDWLAESGKRMSKNLLTRVLAFHKNSSYEVWNVLEKTASYVGERAEITAEDLAFVGGAASIGTAEAFTAAVATADRVAAHVNATKCLKAKTQATTLLWRLNNSFRGAMSVPRSSERRPRRSPEDQVRAAIARRLGPEQICEAIGLLCEAEKRIKGGSLKPDVAIELLINELTR
jgi:DNA polymerase III delta subunit